MTGGWDALAATWSVLGRLVLDAPTGDMVQALREAAARGEWPLDGGDRTSEGLRLLADPGPGPRAIADDHFRLFRGPGERLAVPWASVYLSEEKLLFDGGTFAVRDAYARHGLAAPRLNREPDDHIGLELQFLATLLTRALDAEDAGDTPGAAHLLAEHDAFFTDHLLPFAPEFFARVEQHATTSFHRGLGVLGADAVALVAAELAHG